MSAKNEHLASVKQHVAKWHFVEELRECANMARAADLAGVSLRSIQRWREADAAFDAQVNKVLARCDRTGNCGYDNYMPPVYRVAKGLDDAK